MPVAIGGRDPQIAALIGVHRGVGLRGGAGDCVPRVGPARGALPTPGDAGSAAIGVVERGGQGCAHLRLRGGEGHRAGLVEIGDGDGDAQRFLVGSVESGDSDVVEVVPVGVGRALIVRHVGEGEHSAVQPEVAAVGAQQLPGDGAVLRVVVHAERPHLPGGVLVVVERHVPLQRERLVVVGDRHGDVHVIPPRPVGDGHHDVVLVLGIDSVGRVLVVGRGAKLELAGVEVEVVFVGPRELPHDGAALGVCGSELDHLVDAVLEVDDLGVTDQLRWLVHILDHHGHRDGGVVRGVGIAVGVLAVSHRDRHLVAGLGLEVQSLLHLKLAGGRVDVEECGIASTLGVGERVADVGVPGCERSSDAPARSGVLPHRAGRFESFGKEGLAVDSARRAPARDRPVAVATAVDGPNLHVAPQPVTEPGDRVPPGRVRTDPLDQRPGGIVGLVGSAAGDVPHVVAGDVRRAVVVGRGPRHSQEVIAGVDIAQDRRLGGGLVTVDGDAPRLQPVGRPARQPVGHPQCPRSRRVLPQVPGRPEPETAVQAAVHHGSGTEFVRAVGGLGDRQHGHRSRRRHQLHLQIPEIRGYESGVDLDELDEVDVGVDCNTAGGPAAADGDRHPAGGHDRPRLSHVGQVVPAAGQVDSRLGVHHAEAVLVVEFVVLGVGGGGAVPERPGLPACVVWVVLAGRRGQDQLHVAPAQVAVGAAHQRGHAGDLGGSRAGAAENGRVAAEVGGGGDAGPDGTQIKRRSAHPQVGAHLRVHRPFPEIVHRAGRSHRVVVGVLVQGAVIAIVRSVAGSEDVEDALAPEAVGDATVDGQLPGFGSAARQGTVRGAPTVVGHRRVAHVEGHGVGKILVGVFQQGVVAVDRRFRRNAPHADAVVLRCDDARHTGAVRLGRIVNVVSAGVVVIPGPGDIDGEVRVGVLHPVVDHGHIDARSPGGCPRVLDVDVLSRSSLPLALIVQVPLTPVEGVVDGRIGNGNRRAPIKEVGVEDVLRQQDGIGSGRRTGTAAVASHFDVVR